MPFACWQIAGIPKKWMRSCCSCRWRVPIATKGKAIYDDGNTDSGVPACAGCHQPDGRGNARFPRLAGQHQAYVLKQLGEYKSGRRATDPLMTTVGKRLSADEAAALAEYIAGL